MTRYTNLSRKRTYLQAGFHHDEPQANGTAIAPVTPENTTDATKGQGEGQPPAKKRKRKRGKPKHVHDARRRAAEEAAKAAESGALPKIKAVSEKKKLRNLQYKEKRAKDDAARALASEERRKKRMQERNYGTVCFACRERGHAAKDCPGSQTALEGEIVPGRQAVGICYRCGSNKHTLSRCRKPENSENPFPFASCFVCSGTGHLASSCPMNKSRGIYPNGGCCKLCGETSHLAKDCGMRKPQQTSTMPIVGVGREAGADEDDFHILKRKTAEVDQEERVEAKVKRLANVKAGALSGIVKSFPKTTIATPAAPAKKVVNF